MLFFSRFYFEWVGSRMCVSDFCQYNFSLHTPQFWKKSILVNQKISHLIYLWENNLIGDSSLAFISSKSTNNNLFQRQCFISCHLLHVTQFLSWHYYFVDLDFRNSIIISIKSERNCRNYSISMSHLQMWIRYFVNSSTASNLISNTTESN